MEEEGVAVNIGSLLKDPVLSDLSPDVSLEEIQEQLDILYGRLFPVTVVTVTEETYEVFVPHNGTVKDLKKKIQTKLTKDLKQKCKGISWRYIWKRHWLFAHNTKLTDDRKLIREYGIRKGDRIGFVIRLRTK